MRLIDADAFDERVRVAGGMSEEELIEDFKDGIQAVLYMLSNQPTIQPEPHWIPCSERLPETTGEYLVTKKEMYTHRLIVDIAMYFVNDGWHKADPVIAWMPLPEPYKGVTDGRD